MDLENAERRRGIAARQNAEFAEAERLARTLGAGWKPWMAIRLLEADHRETGDYRPVATVYKVCRGPRLSENSVFVREVDGEVRSSGSYQELFGELLEERHPTKTIEVRGERVPVRRHEVFWSAVERYEPRSAEQLAAGRVAREGRAVEREARERPLFAEEIREGRGRG